MSQIESRVVAKNFLWRFFERFGAQGVTFVVSVILARILDPEVYGTVALVSVVTTILQVFVDSGMGGALIQKKDADDLDFSSVFYFNIIICSVVYIIAFVCAPAVAVFFKKPELISIIRVLSLTLVISGLKNVQQAYVARYLLFRKFFYATLGGTIGAAVVGIVLAYEGFGVWALVFQHLFNLLVDTILLWITVKWRPKLRFSFVRLKSLFSFGWKLLVSALIEVGYTELRQLIIGKKYTSEDLAFYNRGNQFPKLIINNINTSLDSVLLPTMSSEQENKNRVRAITRRAIKTSSFLLMPLMVGLAVCAEPIVRLVLTDKWLPSVFYLRIFCFTYAFYPIHTANLNAIKAMGRSDVSLKLEILKKSVGLTALFSTMFVSVKAMALVLPITSVICQVINAMPNKRLLNYSYFDQLVDIMPQLCLSCVMGCIVYCITFFHLDDWLTLLIQVPVGASIYVLGSKLFRIDSFNYLLVFLKAFCRKG